MRSLQEGNHPVKTDLDILRDHYRFLLDEEDGTEEEGWEMRMVRAYHDQLYKEYALIDLSRVHLEGSPVGLRWRSEKEVVAGRGQFTCGNVSCTAEDSLSSYELPFSYVERGEKKLTLVKVRLCPTCAQSLPTSKKHQAEHSSILFP